jgi:Fe-S-cluster containining protein
VSSTSTSERACARCPHVLGRTCCEVDGGEQLATLTWPDVDRISAATGLPARAFAEVEWLSVEEAQAYESRRPLYHGYFARGPARLTLKRRHSACVFLERGRGCSLGADVRPTACLLYPFELWPDGSWSFQVDRFGSLAAARAAAARGSSCLAVEEAESMDGVLAAFSTTREQITELGERLRGEVRAHRRVLRVAP